MEISTKPAKELQIAALEWNLASGYSVKYSITFKGKNSWKYNRVLEIIGLLSLNGLHTNIPLSLVITHRPHQFFCVSSVPINCSSLRAMLSL